MVHKWSSPYHIYYIGHVDIAFVTASCVSIVYKRGKHLFCWWPHPLIIFLFIFVSLPLCLLLLSFLHRRRLLSASPWVISMLLMGAGHPLSGVGRFWPGLQQACQGRSLRKRRVVEYTDKVDWFPAAVSRALQHLLTLWAPSNLRAHTSTCTRKHTKDILLHTHELSEPVQPYNTVMYHMYSHLWPKAKDWEWIIGNRIQVINLIPIWKPSLLPVFRSPSNSVQLGINPDSMPTAPTVKTRVSRVEPKEHSDKIK